MHDSFPIALLADDLTGALDCAVTFTHGEDAPYVSLNGEVVEVPHGTKVISVNADTRRLNTEQAEITIHASLRSIARATTTLCYVKIDSTLRGHPGLEIGICAKTSRARLVLITPAFPGNGRVVRNGVMLVHGLPLVETEVGRDPLSPARTSNVADVLRRDTDFPVQELPLRSLRSAQLVEMLKAMAASNPHGPLLISCDAETDEDLLTLACAGLEIDSGVLFAGSAGLAGALAVSIGEKPIQNIKSNFAPIQPPVMVVTASQRSMADEQIASLTDNNTASGQEILFDVGSGNTVRRTHFDHASAISLLRNNRNLVLRATVVGILSTLSAIEVRNVADEITRALGHIVASITSEYRIGGLVIVGGDTAAAVLTAVSARGIVLHAEPLPGVAFGVISGGLLDGIPIATKAGAFGDAHTLLKLINYMTTGGERL